MPTVHENLIGVQERRAISTRDEGDGGGVDLAIFSVVGLLLEDGAASFFLLEDGTSVLLLEN